MPIGDLWRPLGIGFVAAVLLWLICAAVMRSLDRGSILATIVALGFWIYEPVTGVVDVGIPYANAILFCLLIGAFAWWAVRKNPPTLFMNRLALFLTVIVFAQIGIHWYRFRTTSAAQAARGVAVGHPPDVYYIILDGYGRTDQLKRVLGYDNSEFIDGLKSLGFYVPDRNHSNYCQTEISLSSSLNLDYIPKLVPDATPKTEGREALDDLVNDSKLARVFRSKGYTNIAVTTGFPNFKFPHADLNLDGPQTMTLFESTLLDKTPIPQGDSGFSAMFALRRQLLLAAFTNLENLARPTATPRFIFAHILAPHPPFVFNEDGSTRPKKGPFGYWDGSDYMEYMGPPADYKSGYVGQAKYLSQRMLEVVKRLLSQPGQKPIIILQGDHGSKLHLDQAEESKTDMNEVFSNLEALYVPDSIKAKLYPEVTPVNFFRIILSGLFGDNLAVLPDRSYYSPFPRPYEFTDETNRVKGPPYSGPSLAK